MANKDLNIGIKVDSSQLDQTVQKVGQLKQLSKTVSIQYDINGKPIDVVIDKTLNLQKQFRALVAERRKVAEGTAEFQLLSTKIGDVEDALARSNAKSRDLLGSLQLIPGPVGQFASQLNGAVSALKLFSSFSLKDLQFQFKELVNDFKDIFTNVGQVNNALNSNVDATEQTTNAFREQGDTIASVVDESKSLTEQIDVQSGAIKRISALTAEGRLINEKFATGLVRNAETGELVAGVINKQTNATRVLSAAELELIRNNKAVTLTTEGVIVAEGAATVATFSLAGAVKALGLALGIGGLILILTFVVDKLIDGAKALYNFVSGTSAAEEATKGLTAALDEQDASYDKSNKSLKRVTNERIALMKAQGASEEQIRKANIKGMLDERDITIKTLSETQDVIRKLQANRTGRFGQNLDNEENNKALERALKRKKELEETYKDQTSAIKVTELNNIAEVNKKIKENGQKALEENKKQREQEANDLKTANQQLKDIRNQNILDSMQDERFKQRSELEFLKAAEQEKIDELKISEELKGQIKEQVALKYDLKLKALNKKFVDEDNKKKEDEIKATEEFTKKLAQISIDAITKQVDRDIAAREEKYSNDLRDLERDKEFIKMSEDTKGFYRAELLKAKEEDIRKIKIEAAIQTYEDELLLLTAQQKNLLEGTDAYYQNQLKVEENAYQTKLLNAQKNNEDITQIEKEHEENLKNIRLQGFIAEKNLAIQRAGVIKGIGDSLQQLAGKNKDVAIAGILVTKAAGVAEIIMNTQIANAKALATLGPIAGPIWVAVNSVAAGLSIAATVKSAIDGINQIKQQGQGTGGGGGGAAAAAVPNYGRNYEKGGMIGGRRHAEGGTIIEAEKGEAIMTRGAVTMFRPLLSLMNQAGGGVSFNSNLTTTGFDNPKVSTPAEDNKPMIVKTYVVSSELTNEQHRQARLKDLSTL